MKKTLLTLTVLALTLVASDLARAQGASGGRKLAVGFETGTLLDITGATAGFASLGLGAATVTFDADAFRVSGVLSAVSIDNDPTDDGSLIGVGVRGVFVLARGERADFGVGGGIGILLEDYGDSDLEYTDFSLEIGAEIRAFVTPNVAFSGRVGISYLAIDDDHGNTESVLNLGSGGAASLGVSYYF